MFVAGPNLSNHPCMYSSNMALWEKCIMCFSSLVRSDVFLSVFILPVLTCLSALAVFSVHSNLWLSPRSVLQVENAVCVSVSFPESLSNLSQADTSHQSWGPHLLNVSLSLSLTHTHTHTHTHARIRSCFMTSLHIFFTIYHSGDFEYHLRVFNGTEEYKCYQRNVFPSVCLFVFKAYKQTGFKTFFFKTFKQGFVNTIFYTEI